MKTNLIKKGTPHPTKPSYKLDSAYLRRGGESIRRVDKLMNAKGIADVELVEVPEQVLIYVKRGKNPFLARKNLRITPKRKRIPR